MPLTISHQERGKQRSASTLTKYRDLFTMMRAYRPDDQRGSGGRLTAADAFSRR
jgi:hypothetical protein